MHHHTSRRQQGRPKRDREELPGRHERRSKCHARAVFGARWRRWRNGNRQVSSRGNQSTLGLLIH